MHFIKPIRFNHVLWCGLPTAMMVCLYLQAHASLDAVHGPQNILYYWESLELLPFYQDWWEYVNVICKDHLIESWTSINNQMNGVVWILLGGTVCTKSSVMNEAIWCWLVECGLLMSPPPNKQMKVLLLPICCSCSKIECGSCYDYQLPTSLPTPPICYRLPTKILYLRTGIFHRQTDRQT